MNPNGPAPPPRDSPGGLGVLLRRLAGGQESTLDAVPGERVRYTAMGGVVLGTAAIATVSMAVAMYAVFGALTNPVAIVFTVLWGLFILNLDRWLMSTIIDRDGWARFVRFLPRVVLALVFGVIIAEPLLLGVYNSAIEKHIHNGRDLEAAQVEAALVRCNPVSDPAAHPAGCTSKDLLTVDVNPDATQAQLDTATDEANKLREKVARDDAMFKELTDKANLECIGVPRARTGRYGNGPVCDLLRSQADTYYRDNKMAENTARLQQLQDRVTELSEKVKNERTDHSKRSTQRSGNGCGKAARHSGRSACWNDSGRWTRSCRRTATCTPLNGRCGSCSRPPAHVA